MASIILFNKPYNVLSQFTDKDKRQTLADYFSNLPGFYPAGRLDLDSEGLLLLTDNGTLQHRISHPKNKLVKLYWVQVEGIPSEKKIALLCQGIELDNYKTRPAQISLMTAPALWPRHPPIRQREKIPTSWLKIALSEGKNRQIRKMTAAIGHPTLRLVRMQIGHWHLQDLQPGEYRSETIHLPQRKLK